MSCVVGNLASGFTWTVEVSGTVAVGTTELTNNASATGNEFDPNLSNNHDDVTTPVGKSAELRSSETPIRPRSSPAGTSSTRSCW